MQKCGQQEITSRKLDDESHNNWKDHFRMNPFYFRVIFVFEADKEIDKSNIGNKISNIYEQNHVCSDYYILSELYYFLKSGYYESNLDYKNLDWFVVEIIKLENKMAFCFRNRVEDIIITKEDKEVFENNTFCRFCEKEIICDKVRDHGHLTVKYRGPAHSKCSNNVTEN